jgi:DNA-binding CsgD family transcriptional regulator
MISRPVYCQRFVGRRRHLDFLVERGCAASDRKGSMVLVEGDAGSGKSRLVAEFCNELAARGLRHAVGSCLQYAKSPFGPLIDALRLLHLDDSTALECSAHLRPTLGRLFPELGEPAPPLSSADDTDKLRQFNALANVLDRLGDKRPTTMVIEDLHWADAATMDFLKHMARLVGTSCLCIVATYRGDELKRGHAFRSVLGKIEREPFVWRIELEPLSDEAMQILIASAVDDRDLIAPETAQAIARRAEGNPLFAEELLKSAIGNPERASGVRDLPRSLREAVLERLDQLEKSDKAILIQASVLGSRFSPDFLSRTVGRRVEDVLPTLKRAIDQQLIVENAADGSFAFRHAVTRDAVYSELLAVEARSLHASVAAAIETSPGAEHRTLELAYQWWAAGDQAKTLRYNEAAGDAADRVCAFRDAVVYFERALESGSVADPRHGHLWRKLAWAMYRCGMGARALSAFESAIGCFLTSGMIEAAAETQISLAHLYWTLADMGGHLEATNHALELIGERHDSPVWFAANVQMAWANTITRCDTLKAQEYIKNAESFVGDAAVWDRVKLAECRAFVSILNGKPLEAFAELSEGAALTVATGDVANAVRCWGNFGLVAARCGEKRVALDAFAEAVQLIDRERPGGWPVPWVLTLYAYAQYLYGNLAEAAALIDRVLSTVMDVPSLDVLVAWAAIPIGLRLGNRALVERCADEELIEYAFRSGSTLIGDIASAYAEFYVATGRPDSARSLLRRALATLTARPNPGDYDAMFLMIAEHGDEADVVRARALLRETEAATKVRSLPASSALFEARAARRRGDVDRATKCAAEAAGLFEALEWPLYQAQALEITGRIEDALVLYRRAGALADAHRVEEALTPPGRRGRHKGILSAREEEVAELIMAGKSNRTIAEQLVLSERTIESHVSSIFSKLQIASRRDLADGLKRSGATRTKDGRA